MGYFSNGSENEMYAAQYCNRCVHDAEYQEDPEGNRGQGCPIIGWHLIWNYSQAHDEKASDEARMQRDVLDSFIPRKGVHNERCKMFIPVNSDHPGQGKLWENEVTDDN